MKIDPERLERELQHMRELIATDPAVHARFDTNGDGEIDGEEWHAVRQLVLRRLMHEALDADAARIVAEQNAAGREVPEELREAAQEPPEGTDGSVAVAVFERDVKPPEPPLAADMFDFRRCTLLRPLNRYAALGMREYQVLDYKQRPVAEIRGSSGPHDALEFEVNDLLARATYLVRRIEQRPRSRVVLVDHAGVFLAQAEVDPRKLGFRCRASWADGELAIRRKFWDSTRFNVDADGKVGELETSPYGGDGGTATLVYAQGRLTLEARRALFLGALLVDLLDDGGDESEHVETGASYALARFLSRDSILE